VTHKSQRLPDPESPPFPILFDTGFNRDFLLHSNFRAGRVVSRRSFRKLEECPPRGFAWICALPTSGYTQIFPSPMAWLTARSPIASGFFLESVFLRATSRGRACPSWL